jgi:hypothetical protein
MFKDPFCDLFHSRITDSQPYISQKGQFMKVLPGAFMAVQHHARPIGQFIHQLPDKWMGDHPDPGVLDLGGIDGLPEEVNPGIVFNPGIGAQKQRYLL